MLTGRRAFQGESKMSALAAILNREPEPMEQVPHELVRIVQRCLRKELDRRAQSMTDLKLALQEVKEESDSGSLASTQAISRTKSRKALWAAALLALIALAGGILVFAQRPDAAGSAPRRAADHLSGLRTYPELLSGRQPGGV